VLWIFTVWLHTSISKETRWPNATNYRDEKKISVLSNNVQWSCKFLQIKGIKFFSCLATNCYTSMITAVFTYKNVYVLCSVLTEVVLNVKDFHVSCSVPTKCASNVKNFYVLCSAPIEGVSNVKDSHVLCSLRTEVSWSVGRSSQKVILIITFGQGWLLPQYR
jgi:hypothetical protein